MVQLGSLSSAPDSFVPGEIRHIQVYTSPPCRDSQSFHCELPSTWYFDHDDTRLVTPPPPELPTYLVVLARALSHQAEMRRSAGADRRCAGRGRTHGWPTGR